ncbi:hypothetical protein MCOR25_010764 [Pyricularia grisea]|uniref:Lipocalin-like domain-containing protein n=1 Tax=Pyricularia grisea TaxID=148305 RepID=A0A6P8AS56_PYRGI|nr:uncharacterized protein PgNI_09225 [Pyricularia grisea]KAI6348605.1 hypothetical protein MCOR25_010764 [Pyricularia grisea]TLD04955.1 hypothetical protein PgNI_09225 [Pyricularia grisea]
MRAESIMQALAGTYMLLNTSTTLNGVPVPDEAYGSNPSGQLIYTASGFMSATITSTDPEDRPQSLTFPPAEGQSDADWANVAKHALCYAGPFSINEAVPLTATSGGVFHGPLTVAHVPSWVGRRQERNFTTYENGSLLLITSRRDGGNEGKLWWKRID